MAPRSRFLIGNAIQAASNIFSSLQDVRRMRMQFALERAKLDRQERKRMNDEAWRQRVFDYESEQNRLQQIREAEKFKSEVSHKQRQLIIDRQNTLQRIVTQEDATFVDQQQVDDYLSGKRLAIPEFTRPVEEEDNDNGMIKNVMDRFTTLDKRVHDMLIKNVNDDFIKLERDKEGNIQIIPGDDKSLANTFQLLLNERNKLGSALNALGVTSIDPLPLDSFLEVQEPGTSIKEALLGSEKTAGVFGPTPIEREAENFAKEQSQTNRNPNPVNPTVLNIYLNEVVDDDRTKQLLQRGAGQKLIGLVRHGAGIETINKFLDDLSATAKTHPDVTEEDVTRYKNIAREVHDQSFMSAPTIENLRRQKALKEVKKLGESTRDIF